MKLYEDLIEKLRHKAEGLNNDGWADTANTMTDAADTIEKLVQENIELKDIIEDRETLEQLIN